MQYRLESKANPVNFRENGSGFARKIFTTEKFYSALFIDKD